MRLMILVTYLYTAWVAKGGPKMKTAQNKCLGFTFISLSAPYSRQPILA